MRDTAILLISCPSQKGITAAVSDFIFRSNGNIVRADEHLDEEHNIQLLRVEWDLDGFSVDMRGFARRSLNVSECSLRERFARISKIVSSFTATRPPFSRDRRPN